MIEVKSKREFKALLAKTAGLVMADFWAPWCGPCMAAKPHVEALAKELAGKITVVSVNVDEVPSDVLTIPTFTFYRDGKELVGVPGWRGRPALRKLMEEQIALGEKPARKTKVKP